MLILLDTDDVGLQVAVARCATVARGIAAIGAVLLIPGVSGLRRHPSRMNDLGGVALGCLPAACYRCHHSACSAMAALAPPTRPEDNKKQLMESVRGRGTGKTLGLFGEREEGRQAGPRAPQPPFPSSKPVRGLRFAGPAIRSGKVGRCVTAVRAATSRAAMAALHPHHREALRSACPATLAQVRGPSPPRRGPRWSGNPPRLHPPLPPFCWRELLLIPR